MDHMWCRQRDSKDVNKEVVADWAERKEPQARIAHASLEENAVAEELDQIWLHPNGSSPYSGKTSLFPWTLAKAFLSSPEALIETIDNRLRVLETHEPTDAVTRECSYLDRLREYAADSLQAVERNREEKRPQTGKYGALLDYLREIGIGPKNDTRVVIFAERVATLHALQADLKLDLKLKDEQVAILHGGLS